MDLLFLDGTKSDDLLAELLNPAIYRGYLKTMSNFSNYSWRNIFLIFKQMPNATKLADFDSWKNEYGRGIIQGSKGIKIFAPIEQKPKKS